MNFTQLIETCNKKQIKLKTFDAGKCEKANSFLKKALGKDIEVEKLTFILEIQTSFFKSVYLSSDNINNLLESYDEDTYKKCKKTLYLPLLPSTFVEIGKCLYSQLYLPDEFEFLSIEVSKRDKRALFFSYCNNTVIKDNIFIGSKPNKKFLTLKLANLKNQRFIAFYCKNNMFNNYERLLSWYPTFEFDFDLNDMCLIFLKNIIINKYKLGFKNKNLSTLEIELDSKMLDVGY